jgi:glycine cleavage system H lipoate-binding protein
MAAQRHRPRARPAAAARALVAGKLLEQNPRLAGEPGLLAAQPAHAGFLAIVAALPRELADARRSLLTAQAFAERRGVPIESLLA